MIFRTSARFRREVRRYLLDLKERQRSVSCPRCGASAGAKCRSTNGGAGEREGIHWQRKKLAKEKSDAREKKV
jgi:hypothetical protein